MNSELIDNKYRVLRTLGEGAYGKVLLVEHRQIGARFALKLLKRNLSDDEQFIERFKREAEILLRFSHPCSVQFRDFGRTADGTYYLATDYCSGVLLEAMLEAGGRFEVLQALDIICAVLSTLEAAHKLGIVHRDIKSANVMIEGLNSADLAARMNIAKFSIKVLDFGIAKLTEDLRVESTSTLKGVSIGTPAYMSPEQAAGEFDLDHRADIYSCGILLYELLCGDVPFMGKSVVQTLLKHLTQPPPGFDPALKIPGYIEAIVMRALEKEKDDRYGSAQEFLEACEGAREQLRIDAVPAAKAAFPVLKQKRPIVSSPEQSSRPKILCLDDNEMILGITKHLFEKEDFQVFTAANFSAIHDYIFNEKVDLMLCDVNMPGLPGNKICQLIKSALPDLKIVLFSNIQERDLERLSKECGANDWISKNTKPDEWVKRIKELLQSAPDA